MRSNFNSANSANSTSVATRLGRRAVLRLGAGGLAMAAAGPALAAIAAGPERRLAFHHLHTGEIVRATYWADGAWQPEGLRAIDRVLRDFRTDEVAGMDIRLLELLHGLAARVESDRPFEVISGYRSPKTNAKLASRSKGVARRSLHMQGMAIDIRLPQTSLASLKRAAIALRGGGVGYYPRSGFIHVDTGRVRYW